MLELIDSNKGSKITDVLFKLHSNSTDLEEVEKVQRELEQELNKLKVEPYATYLKEANMLAPDDIAGGTSLLQKMHDYALSPTLSQKESWQKE